MRLAHAECRRAGSTHNSSCAELLAGWWNVCLSVTCSSTSRMGRWPKYAMHRSPAHLSGLAPSCLVEPANGYKTRDKYAIPQSCMPFVGKQSAHVMLLACRVCLTCVESQEVAGRKVSEIRYCWTISRLHAGLLLMHAWCCDCAVFWAGRV